MEFMIFFKSLSALQLAVHYVVAPLVGSPWDHLADTEPRLGLERYWMMKSHHKFTHVNFSSSNKVQLTVPDTARLHFSFISISWVELIRSYQLYISILLNPTWPHTHYWTGCRKHQKISWWLERCFGLPFQLDQLYHSELFYLILRRRASDTSHSLGACKWKCTWLTLESELELF